MSIRAGSQPPDELYDLNKDYKENLKGYLDEKQAQITLAKFLRQNLGFTVELLSGKKQKIHKFQEMILRAWFLRTFCLNVWGRGVSKSFTVGVFCYLYCIFNPGTKIIVVSANFRTARRILGQIQTFAHTKGSEMLLQCFTNPKPERRPDEWRWEINGGFIAAYPLGSENLRGIRADILVIDEAMMVPRETIEKVLMPFLVAQSDQEKILKIREKEDELIKAGKMKEEERLEFNSPKKVIFLSSASYQFEYLYKLYQRYLKKLDLLTTTDEAATAIENDKDEIAESIKSAKYLVTQISFRAAPRDLINKDIIKQAEEGGAENNTFKREYDAQFVDDSGSYFSAAKMDLCTFGIGKDPCVEIIGENGAEYILALDPNRSASTASDHFAMGLIKIDRENRCGTLVHNYAKSGVDISEVIEYAAYLFTRFNIVYVIIDEADAQFLKYCRESEHFKNLGLKIEFFETDFDNNNEQEGLKNTKTNFKPDERKIAHSQNFNSKWIRKANEWLQTSFQQKRIWFASPVCSHPTNRTVLRYDIPLKLQGDFKMEDFCAKQDDDIRMTKRECALIEVTINANGSQSFDLPAFLKRGRDDDKARKDSYTALLLGAWGLKCFFELNDYKSDNGDGIIPYAV